MALRDLIGWLVKHNVKELQTVFQPSPIALDVERRQNKLEDQLRQRERRKEILRAQVRAMKGEANGATG